MLAAARLGLFTLSSRVVLPLNRLRPASVPARLGPRLRRATMAAAVPASKHYLLTYSYVPDILEKRGPFREEHLGNAKALVTSGSMLLGGALQNPVDGGIFIFRCPDETAVASFVAADPYVKNGLVVKHTIREVAVPPGLAAM